MVNCYALDFLFAQIGEYAGEILGEFIAVELFGLLFAVGLAGDGKDDIRDAFSFVFALN